MTNELVEIDTFTKAGHAGTHALREAELDAVAGGLQAADIIILRWLNANFPSMVPAVFTHGTSNIC
jgi:hypothetical protein